MENVYLDLNLEEESEHPGNRGWMNLFRNLSWSGMLCATYAVVRGNYGARFQTFCEERLKLSPGEIKISKEVERLGRTGNEFSTWLNECKQNGDINFVEEQLIHEFENAGIVAQSAKADGGPRFDKLLPIKLTVSGLLREKDLLSSKGSELSFPIGVALTKGQSIVFFRIQDHVRKMGLGRSALKAIYKKGYTKLDVDKGTFDEQRIRDLFASIQSGW